MQGLTSARGGSFAPIPSILLSPFVANDLEEPFSAGCNKNDDDQSNNGKVKVLEGG